MHQYDDICIVTFIFFDIIFYYQTITKITKKSLSDFERLFLK